ncbi:MAG TPA: M48 family metalloprotease [Pseudomonadales bacterium]|nr:M48 family metalloprotease [Pseudomonadales bacterium]
MKKLHSTIKIAAILSSVCLLSCAEMRGMNVGGYDLTPLADAGDKLAKGTAETPVQEEEVIGRHMAGTLLGASRLSNAQQQQRYVNRVGRLLTLSSSRPQLNWHFGVLQDNDVNAFAAPGGYVFVTSGLLNMLDNEAQLAGVLSHEIAHVTHKDYLKAVRNNNLLGAALDVGAFVGSAATNGQTSQQEREFAQSVVNASKEVYARGLDKSDEYAADKAALETMTKAGYDPYAYVVVMQKLEARATKDSAMALLLQTHPSPTDRLEAMGASLDTMKVPGNVLTLDKRFAQSVH